MRILIDIGHPAHVHYFRNMISIMQSRGHEFLVTARDKEVAHALLKYYNIKYLNRGKGSNNLLGKFFYMFNADYKILKLSIKWKPDILLSFASPYTAHIGKVLNIPHIALTDTEHASLGILAFAPFSDAIITPDTFLKSFGSKHLKFSGYFELCYLHPNFFTPDPSVLNLLEIRNDEKYVIMRFISWDASHDIGHKGLSFKEKKDLVSELSKYAKVFISSENKLPNELDKYKVKIPPERLHDALSFATLYIGEGGTTATECAMIGTPNILINHLAYSVGSHVELHNKYKIQFICENLSDVKNNALNILRNPDAKNDYAIKRDLMLNDKIDVTSFIVWFIENYPDSMHVIKTNPKYQYNFI